MWFMTASTMSRSSRRKHARSDISWPSPPKAPSSSTMQVEPIQRTWLGCGSAVAHRRWSKMLTKHWQRAQAGRAVYYVQRAQGRLLFLHPRVVVLDAHVIVRGLKIATRGSRTDRALLMNRCSMVSPGDAGGVLG